MLRIVRVALCLVTLLLPLTSQAVTVEAEGRAVIANGDLDAARKAAIQDARENAALQANAYISTTQEVSNGILQVDKMQIHSRGQISNLKVVDERRTGQILRVRIRAEVGLEQSCPNGQTADSLHKTVAFTLFPLLKPDQASTGYLSDIQSELPALISDAVGQKGSIDSLNATNLNLAGDPAQAPTHVLPDGLIRNSIAGHEQLDAQYLISGVIRDMSMLTPVGPREPNLLADLYNQADYKSNRHLRQLAIDLYLYDGFSGTLIDRMHYRTQGRWTRPREDRTGFGTALFWQQDYGQKVHQLIARIGTDLNKRLRCEPFAARVLRTDGKQIWIMAGQATGLKVGDTLDIYRRRTQYDSQMHTYSDLERTPLTLTLDEVRPDIARGHVNGDTQSRNIQRDDVVMAQ